MSLVALVSFVVISGQACKVPSGSRMCEKQAEKLCRSADMVKTKVVTQCGAKSRRNSLNAWKRRRIADLCGLPVVPEE